MKYALITPDNEVAMVVRGADRFDVASPLVWVQCPQEAEAHTWVFNGTQVVPAPVDMGSLRKIRLSQLSRSMDDAMAAQVTVAGVNYRAKPIHRNRIKRLLDRAAKGKPLPAHIKDASGNLVALDVPLLEAIQDAIDDQTDVAQERYIGLEDAVAAANTKAELDAVAW